MRELSVSEDFFLPDGSAPQPGEPDYPELDSLAAAAVPVDPRRRQIARTVVLAVMGCMALLLLVSMSVAAIKERDRIEKENAQRQEPPLLESRLALTANQEAETALAMAQAEKKQKPKADAEASAADDSPAAEQSEPTKAKPARRSVGRQLAWSKRAKRSSKAKAKRKSRRKTTAKRKTKSRRKAKSKRKRKGRRKATARSRRRSRGRL